MRKKVEIFNIYGEIVKFNSENLEFYLINYFVIIDYVNNYQYYFSADFLFAVKLLGNAMILCFPKFSLENY